MYPPVNNDFSGFSRKTEKFERSIGNILKQVLRGACYLNWHNIMLFSNHGSVGRFITCSCCYAFHKNGDCVTTVYQVFWVSLHVLALKITWQRNAFFFCGIISKTMCSWLTSWKLRFKEKLLQFPKWCWNKPHIMSTFNFRNAYVQMDLILRTLTLRFDIF